MIQSKLVARPLGVVMAILVASPLQMVAPDAATVGSSVTTTVIFGASLKTGVHDDNEAFTLMVCVPTERPEIGGTTTAPPVPITVAMTGAEGPVPSSISYVTP